jgi:hypothetical protein
MKLTFCLFILLLNISCQQSENSSGSLQKQIDSLNERIKNNYTPGLGEFMSSIQMHHAKLWFAGKNNNWPLANFELGEINEILDDIRKYNSDRVEVKNLPIIDPALDSLNYAIESKNQAGFEKSFIFLTNSCNNCHQVSKHEFNVIKIPDIPPVTNQDFKAH